MKRACAVLTLALTAWPVHPALAIAQAPLRTRNVVLIVTDGLRWQEVFSGPDQALVSGRDGGVEDTLRLRADFWTDAPAERRERLLPFFWNVIAREGQLFGNQGKSRPHGEQRQEETEPQTSAHHVTTVRLPAPLSSRFQPTCRTAAASRSASASAVKRRHGLARQHPRRTEATSRDGFGHPTCLCRGVASRRREVSGWGFCCVRAGHACAACEPAGSWPAQHAS